MLRASSGIPLLLAGVSMLAVLVPAVPASAAAAADLQLSAPASVVMLENGAIYVADTGNDRILVFHPNGTLRFQFGGSGTGDGQLSAPAGVHVGRDGTIYVADTGNDRVQVFHPNGTFAFGFGGSGTGDGQLSAPAGVYRLADGSSQNAILVADTGNDRVQVFHPNGTFAANLVDSDTGVGNFSGPKSITATRHLGGWIYVADTGNDRIQVFQYNYYRGVWYFYRVMLTYGSSGTGDGQFDGPGSIDVGYFNDRRLIVADTGNDRVQVLALTGQFEFKLGSSGTGGGQFSAPAGASMSGPYRAYGTFAVADTGNDRVQVFWPNRTLRFEIGSPPPPPPPPPPTGGGTGGGGGPAAGWGAIPSLAGGEFAYGFGLYGPDRGKFMWPGGVAFGPGGIIGVPDWGNGRIQVFHPNGTFAFELGSRGHGPGQLFYPNGLAFGPGGIIGVLDLGNHRVQVFHPNGTFAFELGSRGHGPGQLFYPNGLAFGPNGLLAVADAGNHRIQVFRIR